MIHKETQPGKETEPLSLEVKVITLKGDVVCVGGKETYFGLLPEAKQIVEQAFGESTDEWLDMDVIPMSVEGGTAIFCQDFAGKLIKGQYNAFH